MCDSYRMLFFWPFYFWRTGWVQVEVDLFCLNVPVVPYFYLFLHLPKSRLVPLHSWLCCGSLHKRYPQFVVLLVSIFCEYRHSCDQFYPKACLPTKTVNLARLEQEYDNPRTQSFWPYVETWALKSGIIWSCQLEPSCLSSRKGENLPCIYDLESLIWLCGHELILLDWRLLWILWWAWVNLQPWSLPQLVPLLHSCPMSRRWWCLSSRLIVHIVRVAYHCFRAPYLNS